MKAGIARKVEPPTFAPSERRVELGFISSRRIFHGLFDQRAR
jgi:hypothetical protein